jgi:membrane-associated protease RseP (regulator of RpoE activity)
MGEMTMNLKGKVLFNNKLALWSVLGLAGLVLGVLGPSSAWAKDDQDTDQAWLGVALQELTPQLREALDVDAGVKGLVIVEVRPDSPAAKAGLQDKDVIVSLGGKTVDSIEDATSLVQDMKPGSRLSVSVLRDGRRRQFTARLAEREDREESGELDRLGRELDAMKVPEPPMPPDAPEAPGMDLPGDMSGRGYLGVNTMALGQQLAEYFGLSENQGVLVTEVSKDSPAEAAGLKAGDIILSVGDSKIDSPLDLMRLIRAHDPEDQVDVVVQRKGEAHSLKAKLGEAKEMGALAPRARHMMMNQDMQNMMMNHEMQGHMREHQGPMRREVLVMRHRSGAEI